MALVQLQTWFLGVGSSPRRHLVVQAGMEGKQGAAGGGRRQQLLPVQPHQQHRHPAPQLHLQFMLRDSANMQQAAMQTYARTSSHACESHEFCILDAA